jgi:hypothetical protein
MNPPAKLDSEEGVKPITLEERGMPMLVWERGISVLWITLEIWQSQWA